MLKLRSAILAGCLLAAPAGAEPLATICRNVEARLVARQGLWEDWERRTTCGGVTCVETWGTLDGGQTKVPARRAYSDPEWLDCRGFLERVYDLSPAAGLCTYANCLSP